MKANNLKVLLLLFISCAILFEMSGSDKLYRTKGNRKKITSTRNRSKKNISSRAMTSTTTVSVPITTYSDPFNPSSITSVNHAQLEEVTSETHVKQLPNAKEGGDRYKVKTKQLILKEQSRSPVHSIDLEINSTLDKIDGMISLMDLLFSFDYYDGDDEDYQEIAPQSFGDAPRKSEDERDNLLSQAKRNRLQNFGVHRNQTGDTFIYYHTDPDAKGNYSSYEMLINDTSSKIQGDIFKTIRYETEITLQRMAIELTFGKKGSGDEKDVTTKTPHGMIEGSDQKEQNNAYPKIEDVEEQEEENKRIKEVAKDYCELQKINISVINHNLNETIKLDIWNNIVKNDIYRGEANWKINEILREIGLLPSLSCNSNTRISENEPTGKREMHKVDLCNIAENASTIEEMVVLVRKMEREGVLPTNATQKVLKWLISVEDTKRVVIEAAVKFHMVPSGCLNSITLDLLHTGALADFKKLQQAAALIQAGYFPRDTLRKLAQGEINKAWLDANMAKIKKRLLSQLPEELQKLLEQKNISSDIKHAILSGSHNMTNIIKILSLDSEIMKRFLPQKILDMLQGRPVPFELMVLITSGRNKSEIKKELETNDDLLREVMSPSMFFFYNLFKTEKYRQINTSINVFIVVLLAIVMISLGCTMTAAKIIEHAKKPKGVLIALFAQFVIMPASAYGLTQLFNLDLYAAIAVLICGCCPGGSLSNFLAYCFNGDMNLSILMTTCSSVLSLALMPLSIYFYSQLIIPLDSGAVVPFVKIAISIVLTIIPVGIGMAIRYYRSQWITCFMRIGGIFLIICTIVVFVLAGVMLGEAFVLYFPLPVLACCAILPMTGYFFGYIFALISREKPTYRRTICVETGCQNVQLCSAVLKLAFDPIFVGVMFLIPLVYMFFQVIEALFIVLIFKLYNRLHHNVTENESDVIKKKSDLESGKAENHKLVIIKEETKQFLNKPDSEKNVMLEAVMTKDMKDKKLDTITILQQDGDQTMVYVNLFK